MTHDTKSNNELALQIGLEVGDTIVIDAEMPIHITAITETGLVRYQTLDDGMQEEGKATFLSRIESADSISFFPDN